MEKNKELKCYNCGKIFRDEFNYDRHKNRKTPCLIREIKPTDKENPNTCIFCNGIFANKSNLNRHYKKCKVKNGGMNVLAEKVVYESEIKKLREQVCDMKNAFDELKQMIQTGSIGVAPSAKTMINNTNNGTINNTTNNFNIHPLTNPCVDSLHVTVADLDGVEDINKWLFKTIYYNPNIPENFSLYLVNDKEHKFLYRENNEWRHANSQEEVDLMLTKITNVLVIKGGDLLNGKNGPYEENTNKFLSLPQKIQNLIESFNDSKNYRDKERLSLDAIKEIALPGRTLIKPYVKRLGAIV